MPDARRKTPLTPEEQAELYSDLIGFCDRELDLLGDIEGCSLLYAGGASLLWLEGLSQRLGPSGHLTALDADEEGVEHARGLLGEADLAAPVSLFAGDVFEPPFAPDTFDLVYSAGLFHELDVHQRPAERALSALAGVVRPGGRVATGDFVDTVPAIQLEDEALQRELAHQASGAELYGIGSPERLAALHETQLTDVRWASLPPYNVRHLDRIVLCEDSALVTEMNLRERYTAFREKVWREGYTRPATVYVEGRVVVR